MNYSKIDCVELFDRCARERDPAALDELHSRYHKTIQGVVIKKLSSMNLVSPERTQDMVQEVFKRILNNSCYILSRFEFRGAGSDFAFIKVVTVHTVSDAVSGKQEPTVALADAEHALPPQPHELDRQVLLHQIDRLLDEIASERERLIFRLYYRAGLTAAKIAEFPSVRLGVSGVESCLSRTTKQIRERLKGKSAAGGLS